MSSFQEQLEREQSQKHPTPVPFSIRLSHRCFELFCTLVFRSYCPLSTQGREHLPEPPFIFCSNHCSHMDSPALMYASGLGFQRFGMIAAQDYFFEHGPRKSLLPLLMNLIPTRRRANRQEIARLLLDCREFIRAGERCLILYPEGTRSRCGEMQKLKRGASLLSTELGVPIVPAYIRGTFEALPVGARLPRPHRIQIRFAAPLQPEPPRRHSPNGSAYTRLGAKLTQCIQELRDHARD